jgi:hypothetical protein
MIITDDLDNREVATGRDRTRELCRRAEPGLRPARTSVSADARQCVRPRRTQFHAALRQLEADEIQRSEKPVNGTHLWDSQMSFQFAAALKAMYYFVRALNDAVYTALLEAKGYRAGAYSSMHACATKAGNPIRPLIEQALPDYFEWFADFRDIRNHMKLGAWTAFGFRGSVGSTQMRVILQNVDDAKRYVSSERESSLVDVSRCLTQSASLV